MTPTETERMREAFEQFIVGPWVGSDVVTVRMAKYFIRKAYYHAFEEAILTAEAKYAKLVEVAQGVVDDEYAGRERRQAARIALRSLKPESGE